MFWLWTPPADSIPLHQAFAELQEQWMIDQYDLTAPLHTETNSCLSLERGIGEQILLVQG